MRETLIIIMLGALCVASVFGAAWLAASHKDPPSACDIRGGYELNILTEGRTKRICVRRASLEVLP